MGYVAKHLDATGILDFWSAPVTVSITNVAAIKALNSVTPPAISGITPLHAYAMISHSSGRESSGALNNNNASTVQVDKAAAGWLNAITLSGSAYTFAANAAQPGTTIIGDVDIITKVTLGTAVDFQVASISCTAATLTLYNVCSGVRIIW